MECNKEEAVRAKKIAEEKMRGGDFVGAHKFVNKAQRLFPNLENIMQMIAICDVHSSADKKINGLENWYGILQVKPLDDAETIKKQYRKLTLLLHPDKNKFAGAEAAFKLVGEANRLLADRIQRSQYDVRYTTSQDEEAAKRRRTYNNFPVRNDFTIRQTLDKAAQQANKAAQQAKQTLQVTQQWMKVAEEMNSLLETLLGRDRVLDQTDKKLKWKRQQLPTKGACLAELARLEKDIADLRRNNLTKETPLADLLKLLGEARQELKSTEDQYKEANEELKRVTKLFEEENIEMTAKKDLLTTASQNYDEKVERYNALYAKVKSTEDNIKDMRSKIRMNRTDYNYRSNNLNHSIHDLHATKEYYAELQLKIDEKVRALDQANASILRVSRRF